MANKNKKEENIPPVDEEAKKEAREKVERICRCERVLSDSDISDFGDASKFENFEDVPVYEPDACREDLQSEYLKLKMKLKLPKDTYSLTQIEANIPACMKYGFRSGLTHMNMPKFSPLTRGHQGQAIAVAAFATSYFIKPHCWNEPTIDRVIEDGDNYYSNSYKKIHTDDRRTLKLEDLKCHLDVCKTFRVWIKIDDPMFAGTFRSDNPKELHIAKALQMFFRKHNACILTSPVLNIAIFKGPKFFNIFDGQARHENCDIAEPDSGGTAKLIIVQNLTGVLFIILEKSQVKCEPFVLYSISVTNVKKLTDLPDESEKPKGEPKRRPSGYRINEPFRAVVQGSYHLHHPYLPEEFHGRGHLTLAIASLVYSKLLSASKWTKVMLDLIFNQSNIYLADLVRVLGKQLDESFHISITEILCDIVLGVYLAKIQVVENIVPGQGKKGKATLETGLRTFFADYKTGILEMKKVYYAIWKEKNKYYFLDPFSCDEEGFRLDPLDPNEAERYLNAKACITMNSSISQMLETILYNTMSKEKDPFIIHGLNVLYIKTGSTKDGSDEKVIFREKNTNRRPPPPPTPPSTVIDDCLLPIEPIPKRRSNTELGLANAVTQYPEMMDRIENFMDVFDESQETEVNPCEEPVKKNDKINYYEIVNPHRLMLLGTKNCLDDRFKEVSRGRQGCVETLAALTLAKVKKVTEWTSVDIDEIVINGHNTYEKIIIWLRHGSLDGAFEEEQANMQPYEKTGSQEESGSTTESSESIEEEVPALDYLEIEAMPNKLVFGGKVIYVYCKAKVIEGETNPLVNLGEAFERYFNNFEELVLENKRLFYAIWKWENKYFIFNPYGNDRDGYRNNFDPACLYVADTINELVNIMYGLLEFNDHHFMLHFVKVTLEPDDSVVDEPGISLSQFDEQCTKFKTKFLPVTAEDFEEVSCALPKVVEEVSSYHAEEEEAHATDGNDSKGSDTSCVVLSDLFEPSEEAEQPDAPERLNLALVTGVVKIEEFDEEVEYQRNLEAYYEALKYKHPPPFVVPPKKNLCDLLDIKLASKSVHSLLSRFSIDCKLAIKEKPGLDPTVSPHEVIENAYLIKLPPKKFLFSKILPSGLTPIRAIDEEFIHDTDDIRAREEECRDEKKLKAIEKVPGEVIDTPTKQLLPTIIPLGPCIKTPEFKHRSFECTEKKKKKCCMSEKEKEDRILRRLICSTENLLLQMVLPNFKDCYDDMPKLCEDQKIEVCEEVKPVQKTSTSDTSVSCRAEPCGFHETSNENIGAINASDCLSNKQWVMDCHYKPCFYVAIICIIAKIARSVDEFRCGILDYIIAAANRISEGTGRLRVKMKRTFRNIDILGIKCNVVVRQVMYADPEHHEPDRLEPFMKQFLHKHHTGIIVFHNASYAFWKTGEDYYFFDPYACNEDGEAIDSLPNEGEEEDEDEDEGEGAPPAACLMKFCNYDDFICRMEDNTGFAIAECPYRIYTVSIAHLDMEKKPKCKKKRKCKKRSCPPCVEEECESEEECKEPSAKRSLIELTEWACDECPGVPPYDPTVPGFARLENYHASAIEVEVLENEITRPILAPFKKIEGFGSDPMRSIPYDRKFQEFSFLSEPMDLCVIAWSEIYEPPVWSVRTIQALFEASLEYARDSLLASEDTTVFHMPDHLLTEFCIGNYTFKPLFSPLHAGILYATEGWNLAMSLEKIFQSPVYSGAVVVCGEAHIGVMKRGNRMYAWWSVTRTKKFRMIVSEDMECYLKLIVKEICQPEECMFEIRIVKISYAKMMGPNCSDIEGLHESMMPSSSLAELHRCNTDTFDIKALFRPTDKCHTPLYVHGTVALKNRDMLMEPRAKRCYFVALFVVVMKRDIIQNPLPDMIDKVMQVAEDLYKLLYEPKFHTEHILKDVRLLDRVFDLRDCASSLVNFQNEKHETVKDFGSNVRKQFKQFFKKYTSGIIQFTNCCYGFWYSQTTECYYYLDPYQCDEKGYRTDNGGRSCLCIFSNICDMVRQMCLNQYEETTGFFIHRIHVETVNASPFEKFQEDPVWTYLDYHWCSRHVLKPKMQKPLKVQKVQKVQKTKKKEKIDEDPRKPRWKNYLIEVPNLIYSLWGTVGAMDTRFECTAGKNQAAIAVALIAMRNLFHPSAWTPAVLDSAVICGDHFYRETQRSSVKCSNRFKILETYKIFPYIWNFEFETDACGVFYGTSSQPTFTDILEYAFNDSQNLIVECNKKIITIMETSDGFYITDSSWTGPPLFSRKRGAIYTIRCKNINTLVYVVTKMLNTNQKLEFSITPVTVLFREEMCQSADQTQPKINRKKILDKPVRSSPGIVIDHSVLVHGNVSVPDEDSYLCYSRNLKMGLAHEKDYENPSLPSLSEILITRTFTRKKRRKTSKSTSVASKGPVKQGSVTSILNKDVGYAKVIDFSKSDDTKEDECGRCPLAVEQLKHLYGTTASQMDCRRIVDMAKHVAESSECGKVARQNRFFDIRSSFIRDDARDKYLRYNEEMAKTVYKRYRHLTSDQLKVELLLRREEDDTKSVMSNLLENATLQSSPSDTDNEDATFKSSDHLNITEAEDDEGE